MIKQTAEQKKRERLLDHDFMDDLAFVFTNVHSCEELEEQWEPFWQICPFCGADVQADGTVIHRMQ